MAAQASDRRAPGDPRSNTGSTPSRSSVFRHSPMNHARWAGSGKQRCGSGSNGTSISVSSHRSYVLRAARFPDPLRRRAKQHVAPQRNGGQIGVADQESDRPARRLPTRRRAGRGRSTAHPGRFRCCRWRPDSRGHIPGHARSCSARQAALPASICRWTRDRTGRLSSAALPRARDAHPARAPNQARASTRRQENTARIARSEAREPPVAVRVNNRSKRRTRVGAQSGGSSANRS